jgi:uncharacterized membrane protein
VSWEETIVNRIVWFLIAFITFCVVGGVIAWLVFDEKGLAYALFGLAGGTVIAWLSKIALRLIESRRGRRLKR